MTKNLEINDYNRAGNLQIVDTNWDHNGTLRVTVRDLTYSGKDNTEAMRRLARRAASKPETTRSAKTVRKFTAHYDREVPMATFAVSRNV